MKPRSPVRQPVSALTSRAIAELGAEKALLKSGGLGRVDNRCYGTVRMDMLNCVSMSPKIEVYGRHGQTLIGAIIVGLADQVGRFEFVSLETGLSDGYVGAEKACIACYTKCMSRN